MGMQQEMFFLKKWIAIETLQKWGEEKNKN